ncbi:MAG TPA: hypothetical protein ENI54_05255 [bacterium]|nr:hypothetical protein [bacterium]
MDDNVVLCAVCAWRGVCKKRYNISGMEIFDCSDFARDISLAVSGFDELLSIINNFKNNRVN